MNGLPYHWPPPDSTHITEEAIELSHRIVQAAYRTERTIAKELEHEPIAVLLAYGSLLMTYCSSYGIAPSEAMRAAVEVLGAKPGPEVPIQ